MHSHSEVIERLSQWKTWLLLGLLIIVQASASSQTSLPMQARATADIPAPHDHGFVGAIEIVVDATDVAHAVFHVTETIPVQAPGATVLLYPEWETTSHAPSISAINLAGLRIEADGQQISWFRDHADVHAFHTVAPAGAHSLKLSFDYVSSRTKVLPQLIDVEWERTLLYPAGWYARNIPVEASLLLPEGMRTFSSLRLAKRTPEKTNKLSFLPETLDRLVDSPVYAGKYTRQFMLSSPSKHPISLDVLADSSTDISVSDSELTTLRNLIVQTEDVFGMPPFAHYDVLVSLSDVFPSAGGLEHLEEGENNLPADYFTHSAAQLNNRDLIAHELVHVWNGTYRMPAGLWSPDFNEPIDPSLLWVYEGQTEFWGRVLAARSGMRTTQQTLDKIALDASVVRDRPGREWKTLADSTLDVLYMPGNPVPWRSWQRREDYYPEGVLFWLDVDAHLRELSHERYGLDDFSKRFFGVRNEWKAPSLYSFDDVVEALNSLAPADWQGFLNRHLQTRSTEDALAGLARSGWRLVFNDTPTETFLQDQGGGMNLDASLGIQVAEDGVIRQVRWDSPAFKAGIDPGARIVDVCGTSFSLNGLLSATASSSPSMSLVIQDVVGTRKVEIGYTGGLRYPHLERIFGATDRITPLFAPR